MAKDLWVNMDRFSELTNDIADKTIQDVEAYVDLSRKLGSEVQFDQAVKNLVETPKEFETTLNEMKQIIAQSSLEQDELNKPQTIEEMVNVGVLDDITKDLASALNGESAGNAAMENMQNLKDSGKTV